MRSKASSAPVLDKGSSQSYLVFANEARKLNMEEGELCLDWELRGVEGKHGGSCSSQELDRSRVADVVRTGTEVGTGAKQGMGRLWEGMICLGRCVESGKTKNCAGKGRERQNKSVRDS